jgi:carbamoyl-phosphate synthase large subunit
VTVGIYVARSGALHGWIALERQLAFGTTMACWVVRDLDRPIAELVERLAAHVEIRGSCNVQLVATYDGRLVPFEVNGRISGTASIRHHLGFPDVCWTVEEWLLGRDIEPAAVKDGAAVRLLMDVIYPGSSLEDVGGSPDRPFLVF